MSSDQGEFDGGQVHAITRCTGRLSAALDQAADAATWSMTADEQRAALVELTRAQARLAALRLRVLAAGDDNQIGAESGASSTAAWLAHATRQVRAKANADLNLANALDGGYGATRAALAAGAINVAQARVVIAAVDDLPDQIGPVDRGRAEAHLIELAADFDAKALKVLGRKLFEVIAPDQAEEQEGKELDKEEKHALRKAFLKLRDNGDGTSTGSFKLPTLHAEALTKMLQALTAPRRLGPDGRSNPDGTKIAYPTLLGHGFMELIERFSTSNLADCGGMSSTIVVTLTEHALRTGIGAASLDTGGKISVGEARRLACSAGLIPVVLGGESQPLDVGRQRRLHTKTQRTALAVRDGGCTAENCDRPPGWCECHHDKAWADGGHTTVDNGRLLCWWHHRLAHDTSYQMTTQADNKVRFRRRQ